MPSFQPGQMIGPYKVVSLLGKGGMVTVTENSSAHKFAISNGFPWREYWFTTGFYTGYCN